MSPGGQSRDMAILIAVPYVVRHGSSGKERGLVWIPGVCQECRLVLVQQELAKLQVRSEHLRLGAFAKVVNGYSMGLRNLISSSAKRHEGRDWKTRFIIRIIPR